MERFEFLKERAEFLVEHLRTDWKNYDFSEKSRIHEKRVPEIYFFVDVEVVMNEVRHEKTGFMEEYVREKQITFEGNTFIFEISAQIADRIVQKFYLDVFTPAGDGKGGIVNLLSQRVS